MFQIKTFFFTLLVRDVHQSLTVLGKKASDADKAVAMLSQCQEQILTLEDAKPLVRKE